MRGPCQHEELIDWLEVVVTIPSKGFSRQSKAYSLPLVIFAVSGKIELLSKDVGVYCLLIVGEIVIISGGVRRVLPTVHTNPPRRSMSFTADYLHISMPPGTIENITKPLCPNRCR